MASPAPESIKPILLESAEPKHEPGEVVVQPAAPPRAGAWPLLISLSLSAFWIGGAAAYLVGYFGPAGLLHMRLQDQVLAAVVAFLPPVLFIVVAWALARGAAVTRAAQVLAVATDKLFATDEFAARSAARL